MSHISWSLQQSGIKINIPPFFRMTLSHISWVLNSCQNKCFLIINSNNKELIHHIHFLEYIFYHWNFVDFISFKSMIFNLDSTHQISFKYFSFNKTIFYLTWLIVATSFLFTRLAFYYHSIIYKDWIHLWLQSKKSFNNDSACFIPHFTDH